MLVRKRYHLTGKEGIKAYEAAFAGANGEHLADSPGKSPELFHCNVAR